MTTHAAKRELTGWHVLAIFSAFFGAIFAVSGTFFWVAQKTFPGSDPAAYRRGIYYNRILAEAARQDELGWHVTAGYEAGRLRVAAVDKQGQPLSGERVQARVGRPTTHLFDQMISLEEQAGGAYVVPLRLEPGYWDVEVRIGVGDGGARFRQNLRLWIDEKA